METTKDSPFKNLTDEMAEKVHAWSQANPQATLTEIEKAVEKELATVRRSVVERIAQTREVGESKRQACPGCGSQMVKNGRKKRKLKTKEGQVIELERQQLRCLQCGMTLFPPG